MNTITLDQLRFLGLPPQAKTPDNVGCLIMRPALLLIVPLVLLSCQQEEPLCIQYPEGGYPYITPTNSNDSSCYALPLKSVFSKADSMIYAYGMRNLYRSFKEPNLSTKPPSQAVFRYRYSDAFGTHPVLITLTEEEIIVKEGIKGHASPYPDENRLSDTEYEHYMLMNLTIPIYLRSNKPERIKYVDSMVALYPELLDAYYYNRIMDKAQENTFFVFTTRRIPISRKIFHHLVGLINESGYWQLPYQAECPNLPNDAGGYGLEAATPKQYHMISRTNCPDDSVTSRLVTALAELEKVAQLNEEKWLKKYRAMNPVKPKATISDTVTIVEVELDTTAKQQ